MRKVVMDKEQLLAALTAIVAVAPDSFAYFDAETGDAAIRVHNNGGLSRISVSSEVDTLGKTLEAIHSEYPVVEARQVAMETSGETIAMYLIGDEIVSIGKAYTSADIAVDIDDAFAGATE